MTPIKIINLILFIIMLALVINLIQPMNKLTGNLIYNFDRSELQCYFNNFDKLNEISIVKCCYEIQKQLICKPTTERKLDLKCYVSEFSERYYLINNKVFNYCKKEGYDVKIE